MSSAVDRIEGAARRCKGELRCWSGMVVDLPRLLKVVPSGPGWEWAEELTLPRKDEARRAWKSEAEGL